LKKTISEINVTSLVDVTVVLLIIFMITAPLFRSGIEIELPKSKSDDLKPQDGLVITLTREDAIFLDDEKVSMENFQSLLMTKYSTTQRKIVLVQADKEVAYGKVINVLDQIKGLGITNLGLIVDSDKSK